MTTGNFKPNIGNMNSEIGVLTHNGLEKKTEEKDSLFSKDFPTKGGIPEEINSELLKLNKDYFLNKKDLLTPEAEQKLINLWYADHDFRRNPRNKDKDDERKKIEIENPAILLGINFEKYFTEVVLLNKIMIRQDNDLIKQRAIDFQIKIIKNSIGKEFLSIFDEKPKGSLPSRELFLHWVELFFYTQIEIDAYLLQDKKIHTANNYSNVDDKNKHEKLQKLLEEREIKFDVLNNIIKKVTGMDFKEKIRN